MPKLGADMEDATLIEWKVQEGDHVNNGDIIAEIETVKGDIDVEVFENGIVEKIVAQPGQKLPVGTVLAYINTNGQHVSDQEEPKKEPPTEIPPTKDPVRQPTPPEIVPLEKDPIRKPSPPEIDPPFVDPIPKPPSHRNKETGEYKASPLARKMAHELGINLSEITPSSTSGIIHKIDIEQYQESQSERSPSSATIISTSPEIPTSKRKANMRSAIAAAMSKSNNEIPHYFVESTIDLKKMMDWLINENRQRTVKDRLLPIALLLKATSLALSDIPELNAYWIDGTHQVQKPINIGITIALREGGLVIPAIQNTNQLTIGELMDKMTDVIMRARSANLRSSELSSGTITVTSLGDRGAEKVMGIIYPPQVALVGFGKIMDKRIVVNSMLAIRPTVVVTLAADHRATDGLTGSRFLERLDQLLQSPEQL